MTKRAVVAETSSKEAESLAEKTSAGELAEIRTVLDKAPAVVKELGDIGRVALLAEIDVLAGGNQLLREAQRRFLSQLQSDIEGPDPTWLEKLLAQEIVLCRQHLINAQVSLATLSSYSFSEGEFRERQIDRAQKRYLAAIKTLAQARRMQIPALQLNVATEGGKQVNISAGA